MNEPNRAAEPTPIAIIGMACLFPQASDLAGFWNNILGEVDAIGEPGAGWDAPRYLAAGRIKTQAGGYIKDLYRFDPREFGIMPNSMDGGEPDQFLALRIARDALADAGYLRPDADHTDTGVILGHSTYLHRGQVTVIQTDIVIDQTIELVRAALPGLGEEAVEALRERLQAKLPPMNADTAPGLVPNVMTGRIANRLNLRGPNYLVDAACSSSLLAVGAAIDELRAGRSRMMLAGGVNASLPADVTTIFTQLGALSARGKVRPFDAASDGTLLGEGLGVVVLKRLPDALADSDRIYAVLRGIGQSSDGRGTGLLAPSLAGESLAMRRAYEASGVDPASIGLVEAHGTGIPLGDRTEVAALKSVFGERATPIGVKALGSVKSMISHCIPAAGVAGLIKVSLALHHRVLPPTLCDRVNPELGIEQTPFYVNTRAAPWISRLGEPRRAAVNAFGFGGTNSHAIVEQAPAHARRPPRLGAWPAELCVVSAPSDAALIDKLDTLVKALAEQPRRRIAEIAAALARDDRAEGHRVALVAKDADGLVRGAGQALARLRQHGAEPAWATRGGVAYASRREAGRLAFIFPGEGSQYPEMFADLAPCFEKMQEWLDFWHGLYDLPQGQTRTDIVFPSCEIGEQQRRRHEQRMHDMDVGSESVFIGGMAMHELLESLGVVPDVMLGHSSGESAALGASGANPALSAEDRAECIRQHYAAYEALVAAGKIPTGALLAVGALPPDTVEREVAAVSDVVVAMDNCSNQMVLYGSAQGIAAIQRRLGELGGICLPLPFDRGYHTPEFADASSAFLAYYKSVKLGRPRVPLYSCAIADLFPQSAAAVRKLAAAQWSRKVRFRETILKMHDDGVRLFVEVGPSANLTAFVNDILIDRDFAAVPTNLRRKGGVEQLLTALGQLYVAGRFDQPGRLFRDRAIADVELSAPEPAPRGVVLDNTMPMIRLDEADRDAIRQLLASEVPTAAAPATPAAEQPTQEAAPRADAGDAADPRGQVMAAYFELMRGFLDQTRGVVQRWPGAAAAPEAPLVIEPAWPSTHAVASAAPMLDEIVEQTATHVVARSRFGLHNDNFIRDHVMSGPVSATEPALFGLSCVPFTVSLEVMAEACALLAAGRALRVIENVKAFDWVALDDGAIELEVRAEAVPGASGRYTARVQTGRGPVLSAEFGFDPDWRLPAVAELAEHRESCLNSPHLYATGMFHGPVFQSMRHVLAWDDSGIDVELSEATLEHFFAAGHTPSLVTNPVLLDAMGQVVACWLVQYVGTDFHAFPSTIERIELYEPCPSDRAGLRLRMRQQPVDAARADIDAPRAWSLECVDAEGRVLMRGSGLVNLFFRVPAAYHEVRTDPLNGWLGHRLELEIAGDGLLWELPLLSEEFTSRSGGICLRILAHALLAAPEREQWRALQTPPRHRREWLFGRAALKEAVRWWIYGKTGRLLYPTDIVVSHDERGAPQVQGWWSEELIPAPSVSLAHDETRCLAAVAAPQQPVGVDLEALGRVRDPELVAGSFTAAERELLAGLAGEAREERVLRLWCAKEAAAKCLGIGLQGRPEAFEVVSADEECELLLVRHSEGWAQARLTRRGDTIMALAGLEFSSTEVDG